MNDSLLIIKQLADRFFCPTPSNTIKKQFRELSQVGKTSLLAAEQAFRGNRVIGDHEFERLAYDRLNEFRKFVIPWINSVHHLEGAHVLEIGSGTGNSTVALAEQGANTVGCDVCEKSVMLARQRLKAFGLDADLHVMNGVEIAQLNQHFDLVFHWASLEHMTYSERLASLADAWKIINPNGLLVVVESPNRLWYWDSHTSEQAFFHWLPDELAIPYAKFSPRKRFAADIDIHRFSLARYGRGVSFHEYELAIGKHVTSRTCSSLGEYLGTNPMRRILRYWTKEYRYMRLLSNIRGIPPHVGWREQTLTLAIRKGSE